ncbi:MAG: hypothetical protein ACOCVV_04275 [Marinobacter sp.]
MGSTTLSSSGKMIKEAPNTRRTLVFCISSYKGVNTGVGGHYRSVREIADMLQPEFDVRVLTFGNLPSPVLADKPYYRHVPAGSSANPLTWVRLRRARKALDLDSPEGVLYLTVGHLPAYIPVLLCMAPGSGPVAHVKPGGPSFPRSYIYNGIPMMVFSRQDYELFAGHDDRRPLMVAPGRVSKPPYDPQYLKQAVPQFLGAKDRLRLLTVCRVAREKEASIRMMYGALENVRGDLVSIHIGIPQSPGLLKELERMPLPFAHHLAVTDQAVDTAARAIHECDLFIGLGRSAIEAMALGKIPFVPVNDHQGKPRLVAVTADNWRVFDIYNFTDRTPISELEQAGQVVTIEEVVSDYQRWGCLGDELHEIYENHLSVQSSAVIWRSFCDNAFRHKTARHLDIARFFYYLLFLGKRKIEEVRPHPLGNRK